jgi:hypothetical protein
VTRGQGSRPEASTDLCVIGAVDPDAGEQRAASSHADLSAAIMLG